MDTSNLSIFERRRGSALIIVLIATLVLTTMGTALMAASTNRMRNSTHRLDMEQARQLAELGLQHGVAEIQESVSYEGNVNYTPPQSYTWVATGQFRVELPTPPAGQASNLIPVVGVGRVESLQQGNYLERRVQGTVNLTAPDPIYKYAVFTKHNQQFDGNFTVGSIDIKGNIHANGSISLQGSPTINGAASACGTITTTGSPSVLDGTTAGVAPKPFPTVDTAAIRAEAESYGIQTPESGTLDYTGSNGNGNPTEIHIQGRINGNLRITGNARIILDGPVYVTGNVDIEGNTTLGNGMLITEGKIKIAGNNGTTANSSELGDNNLALVSLNTENDAIWITGNPGITGGLYCPDGGVTIDGNANILGTVAADRVYSVGNGVIQVNESYQPPASFPPHPSLVSWEEL